MANAPGIGHTIAMNSDKENQDMKRYLVMHKNKQWTCKRPGCYRLGRRGTSGINALVHYYQDHLRKPIPEAYTKVWCNYCTHHWSQHAGVKCHQSLHNAGKAAKLEHFPCTRCRVTWSAKLSEHACPDNYSDPFRKWNRHTFEFDYPVPANEYQKEVQAMLINMLCPQRLKVEPNSSETQQELVVEQERKLERARSATPEDEFRLCQLENYLQVTVFLRDSFIRADWIRALRQEISEAERDGLAPTLGATLRAERMRLEHEIDALVVFKAAASLSKSAHLLSDRHRAIYFAS